MAAAPKRAVERSSEVPIRLPVPCLMLITDRRLAGGEEALLAAVEAAIDGGVNAVQVREKNLPPAELLHLAQRLREAMAGRAALIVNGALEVALAAGADGVHLAEAAAMVERPARPFLVGRSVHSREAAEKGWEECSDYLIAGPVFATPSHAGREPAGRVLIEECSWAVALPVLAVGGIDARRVAEVVRVGASGVAVISAVLGSNAPRAAARRLSEALDEAWDRRAQEAS